MAVEHLTASVNKHGLLLMIHVQGEEVLMYVSTKIFYIELNVIINEILCRVISKLRYTHGVNASCTLIYTTKTYRGVLVG